MPELDIQSSPRPLAAPQIALLITDLDNTLYDWVTFFSRSFYDMVQVAARILSVSDERLLNELRSVHQRFHSSEHPFALLETESVTERFGHLARVDQAAALDEAFHAFNRTRLDSLHLYEGVEESLRTIRGDNTFIVAHTEATVPNALFRLRKLGVERYFDRLYASTPQGSELPVSAHDNIIHNTPIDVRYLPIGERKPNPHVLIDICSDLHIAPNAALYVGDSISRDIGMARTAGLWSAWAAYGTHYEKSHWERLVRITHWTQDDVQRAQLAAAQYGSAQPDFVLHRGFAELLDHFSFIAHR